MLRLPAALLEDISHRAGGVAALSQTCTALWVVLNRPETQLRFYLAQRRRLLAADSNSSDSNNSSSSRSSADVSASSRAAEAEEQFGPDVVYGLLSCRAKPTDAHGTLRLVQLMLACGNMTHLFPTAQHGAAVQHMLATTTSSDAGKAVDVLMTALPHAEHCLLHFSAASGHLQLLKLLLPRSTAPVRLHSVLHYVKTSAFLAAAAGEVVDGFWRFNALAKLGVLRSKHTTSSSTV